MRKRCPYHEAEVEWSGVWQLGKNLIDNIILYHLIEHSSFISNMLFRAYRYKVAVSGVTDYDVVSLLNVAG